MLLDGFLVIWPLYVTRALENILQGSSFGLSSTLVPSAIHTDKPAIRTDKFLLPTALQKRTEPDAGLHNILLNFMDICLVHARFLL